MATDTFDGSAAKVNIHDANWVESNGESGDIDAELNGSGGLVQLTYQSDNLRYSASSVEESWVRIAAGYRNPSSNGGVGVSINADSTGMGVRAQLRTDAAGLLVSATVLKDGVSIGVPAATAWDTDDNDIVLGIRRNGSNVEVVIKQDGQSDQTLSVAEGGALTGGNPGIYLNVPSSSGYAIEVLEWSDVELSATSADVTAPVLSSPSYTGATRLVDLSVTTDEDNDVLWWVVTEDATQPSQNQIVAGNDHTDTAAYDAGSQSVTTTGAQAVLNVGPLDIGTTYWAHLTQVDTATNQSVVVTIPLGDGAATTTGDSSMIYETTVAAVTDQSNVSLTSGPDDDTGMVGNVLIFSESGNDANFAKGRVTAYDATGNGGGEHYVTFTKDSSGYTVSVGDRVRVEPAYSTMAATIPADGLDADSISSAAVSKIQTGLASASTLSDVASDVDAILIDTSATLDGKIDALNDPSVADILTTQMTESYATDGSAPTVAQALMAIYQRLFDASVSGTTLTIKQLDGTTTAMTITLDDGTNPTSIGRTG